ncbi:LapA family protein [Draconibacterium halophilum]|uniref:LapA family protein n=1 Tax=Draconibacterium halophilum TaxID=2706887 RepID=A0A6C0RD48_9BACT|nr:LapA family protein [Draconibacterium halophilum]QIA07403.1 LapA family protein [Draconibacterium halophilum]
MQKTFIGILLVILAVVLFALNNSSVVSMNFWKWNIESNLSLVLIIAVTFGAMTSYFLSLPYRARKNHEIRNKEKTIKGLENQVRHLENKNKQAVEVKSDEQKLSDASAKL